MSIVTIFSKINLVSVLCIIISACASIFLFFSFFMPWAENRDAQTNVGICDAIFPPLFDYLLETSCKKGEDGKKAINKWSEPIFMAANYITSALLFATFIIIFLSIMYDITQIFRKSCHCCHFPIQLRHLNVIAFIICFIALNFFIFLFFFDAEQLNKASSGSLIEVGYGFWFAFVASLLLLISGFVDVAFSSPPKQKKAFL